MRLRWSVSLALALLLAADSRAEPAPTTAPASTAPAATDELPHVHLDVAERVVRVECETIGVEAPLEFFCVRTNGPEHESALRTDALPSHVHLALLMIGLEPGKPAYRDEQTDQWHPPTGSALRIECEFERGGKSVTVPAHELLKNQHTGEPAPPFNWVFVGSRLLDEGTYGADAAGYVVSLVNFELSLIELGALASSSNEELLWVYDPQRGPATGEKVTMILRPAEDAGAKPE